MDATGDLSRDEVQHALFPLLKADNRTNIRWIAREYAWLALSLAYSAATYQAWSLGRLATPWFLVLGAVGVVMVAIGQHRLSGLAHEASHYTLFRDKLANELASDLLLMFPIVAMTQRYRVGHLGHHRFVNDPGRDPDLIRLNHPRPQRFPISKRRFWARYVLEGFWPPSILSYLFGRARAANLGTGQDGTAVRPLKAVYNVRVARSMRGAYWLAALSAVHILDAWPIFGLFWVVPLLTVYPILMQLREVAHHANTPDDGDLTNSRVFFVHPFVGFAIFPYGQSFHLTHHLNAMVPHYRLAEAHALLLQHRPYRETVEVCHGYFFRRPGTGLPCLLDVLARDPIAKERKPAIFRVGDLPQRSSSRASACPPTSWTGTGPHPASSSGERPAIGRPGRTSRSRSGT
jgi:fatty acid desaturase